MGAAETPVPDIAGVGRRAMRGVDPSALTADERARLVRVDPHAADTRRAASATVVVEVSSRDPRMSGSRREVQVATDEQRRLLVARVEAGDWLLVSERPAWFAHYRSGDTRLVPWPQAAVSDLARGSVPAGERARLEAATCRSAARAQQAFAAARTADIPRSPLPGDAPDPRFAYRPPS